MESVMENNTKQSAGMEVERRLREGRLKMDQLGERTPKRVPGTPSPYLDTQLFPDRKKPYHE
jgi:hypothetical protein